MKSSRRSICSIYSALGGGVLFHCPGHLLCPLLPVTDLSGVTGVALALVSFALICLLLRQLFFAN